MSAQLTAAGLVVVILATAGCTPQEPRGSARPSSSPSSARAPFTDVAPEVGLGGRVPSWGSLFVDYDLDGMTDLFMNRHKRFPQLFHNDDAAFALVSAPALRVPSAGRKIFDRHGCAWGEANGDGRPDLYCSAGARGGTVQAANQLLLQEDAGLRDVAAGWNAEDPSGRGRSVNWFDFDTDGDLDIFVANEIRPGHPNVLLRNDRDGFTPVDAGLGHETPTRSSSWSDWDNDGDPDVFVLGHGFVASRAYRNEEGNYSEESFPFLTGRSWLSAAWSDFDSDGWDDVALVSERRLLIMRNRRGSLVSAHSQRLAAGRMIAWLDVENDGDLDAFVLQGRPGDPPDLSARDHPDLLLVNDDGSFAPAAEQPPPGPPDGNGDSVAAADFDRDGDVDLHVTESYLEVHAPPRLLRNEAAAGDWIGVRLNGGTANPFGIGARIVVRAGGRRFHDLMTDGVVFKSQSDVGYAHFGTGEAETAQVRVQWPDGTASCIETRTRTVVLVSIAQHHC